MFISSAQAPYEGVYQRQSTGLPRPEFIPQYPHMPSANPYDPSAVTNGSQTAYQNNAFGGPMYVPMPPSYEQSQNEFQQKKHE